MPNAECRQTSFPPAARDIVQHVKCPSYSLQPPCQFCQPSDPNSMSPSRQVSHSIERSCARSRRYLSLTMFLLALAPENPIKQVLRKTFNRNRHDTQPASGDLGTTEWLQGTRLARSSCLLDLRFVFSIIFLLWLLTGHYIKFLAVLKRAQARSLFRA